MSIALAWTPWDLMYPMVTEHLRLGALATAMVIAACSSSRDDYPLEGTWTTAAPMPVELIESCAATLPDGRVLVAGGRPQGGANVRSTNATWLYDAAANAFTDGPQMELAHAGGACFRSPMGKVVVVGGGPATKSFGGSSTAIDAGAFTVEVLDGPTAKWKSDAHTLRTGSGRATAMLPDGRIVLIGGMSRGGAPEDKLASAEMFAPDTGVWTDLPDAPRAKGSGSVAVALGRKILVVDGTEADLLDADTGAWSQAPPPPQAVAVAGVASLDGTFAVLDGDSRKSFNARASSFDVASSSWASPAAGTGDSRNAPNPASCGAALAAIGPRRIACISHQSAFLIGSGTGAAVQTPRIPSDGGGLARGTAALLADGRLVVFEYLGKYTVVLTP